MPFFGGKSGKVTLQGGVAYEMGRIIVTIFAHYLSLFFSPSLCCVPGKPFDSRDLYFSFWDI